MYNGIIIVNKEKGFTSHDVVAKLRGILKQKKIGHTGTLDPDACGVLPVCLGNATKLCSILTDKTKEYIATMELGIETDTYDSTGKILNTCQNKVDKEQVFEVIKHFTGKIEQVPPMYSALKVNGKKLYEYARAGIVIEREKRPIQIYELEILEFKYPFIKFRVLCSKGTYIRSLCHDIGNALGVYGRMNELVRTRVEDFYLENALLLQDIENLVKRDELNKRILSVEDVFARYPKIFVAEHSAMYLENGNKLIKTNFMDEPGDFLDGRYRIYHPKFGFYALYDYCTETESFKPFKMFITCE